MTKKKKSPVITNGTPAERLKDYENIWRTSRYFIGKHFIQQYNKRRESLDATVESAKIFIVKNIDRVTNWRNVNLSIEKTDGSIESYESPIRIFNCIFYPDSREISVEIDGERILLCDESVIQLAGHIEAFGRKTSEVEPEEQFEFIESMINSLQEAIPVSMYRMHKDVFVTGIMEIVDDVQIDAFIEAVSSKGLECIYSKSLKPFARTMIWDARDGETCHITFHTTLIDFKKHPFHAYHFGSHFSLKEEFRGQNLKKFGV